MLLLCIFWLLLVVWGVVGVRHMNGLKKSFASKPVEWRNIFDCFARRDTPVSFIEEVIGVTILWPVRITVFVVVATISLVLCLVASAVLPARIGREFFRTILRWDCQVVALMNGFTIVNYHLEKGDKGTWKQTKIKTPIGDASGMIVANHLSGYDILMLVQTIMPAFVANHSVHNIPLIGNFARAIDCIFVDRDVTGGDTRKVIADWVKENPEHPLVVFPEGTTSNGDGILSFSTGAFEVPRVAPMLIFYEGTGTHIAYVLATFHWWLAAVLASTRSWQVEFFWLLPRDKGNRTTKEFAQAVQAEMTEAHESILQSKGRKTFWSYPPTSLTNEEKVPLRVKRQCLATLA